MSLFFKAIESEAAASGIKITNIFSNVANQVRAVFSQTSTIKFSDTFSQNLAADETALVRYSLALKSGMSEQEAFNATMRNASPAAQQFAQTMTVTGESLANFTTKQKLSEITLMAQNKSLANVRSMLNTYNSGLSQLGVSQQQFVQSVGQSNSVLGQYLTGLNGAEATMGGYIGTLISAKVATIGLRIATTALNAVIGMGIGLIVSLVMSGISKLIEGIKTAIDNSEALREKTEEVTRAFESQKQSLSDTKSKLDSLVSRYEALSKGVDGLNQNVSLSNDEYSEYLDICNQIGDMFPSLIQGYDEQGNAILTLKGNVEGLTQAYNDMVIAANNTLLVDGKTLFKDFKNQVEELNESNFKGNDMTLGVIENLDKILNSEDLDDAINQYAATGTTSMVQIVQALKDAGLEQFGGTWQNLWMDAETGHDFIKRAIQENRTVVQSIVSDWNTQADEATKNMVSLAQAYIDNSILQGNYSNVTSNMKGVLSSLISSFDYSFYDSFENVDDLYSYLAGMLDDFNSLSSDDRNTFELAFNAKTALNNGECTVGEYLNRINGIEDAISNLDDDTQAQIRLLLNDDDVRSKIDALTNGKGSDFTSWVNGLTSDQLDIAYKLSLDTESANYTLEEWKSKVENYEPPEELKFSFSDLIADEEFSEVVDNYINGVSTLQDALKSLQDGDFENSDFVDLVREFPELADDTDNLEGAIKELLGSMNNDIATEFNAQFGNLKTSEDREQLEAFMDSVLKLGEVVGSTKFAIDIEAETNGMDNLWTAMKESVSSTGLTAESIKNLKARYQDLENYDAARLFEKTANGIHLNTKALRELESEYEKQTKTDIDDTLDSLIEQYNDLTEQINNASDSASTAELYAKRNDILDQINDTAELASMYDGLTSAFKRWEEAQSIGEEGDMYDSLAGGLEHIKELYDEGLIGTNEFRAAVQLMSNEDLSTANIDELISAYENGYGIMTRYFQDSSDGCINFLRDVESLNSEWAHMNEDGSWEINFGVGSDQEVADALGINVESVQAIMRKLSDYGFDINLDSIFSQLDNLQSRAEQANQALIEIGATDITFNFGTDDIDYLNEQIEQSKTLLNSLYNDDGELNVKYSEDDVENAIAVIERLIYRKQSLDDAAILKVDTSTADSDVSNIILKLQEFKSSYNNLEVKTAIGADTTEAQTACSGLLTEISGMDAEILATLGIDTTSIETLNSTINAVTPEVMVKAGLDASLIEGYQAAEHNAEGTVIWDNNVDKVTSWINQSHTASGVIDWRNNTRNVKTYFTATGTVNWTNSSRAQGTAYSSGNWGTKDSGIALGGEVGQELVVRNGKFFTIGEDGAEFFAYKKNDIIFNAEQTRQILANGKITNGKKRGVTYATGTAFSSGSGRITGGGTVITTPTGGGSSGSGGSSSSSSSEKEDEPKKVDWIEIAIERIERAINKLKKTAESAYKSLKTRSAAASEEISKVNEELSLQQKAYERYIQEANSVGLSSDLAAKVRDGTIDINEYDSDTQELISDYQEWYEKALDCSDAIDDLHESLASLYEDNFKNIQDDFDNQLSLLEHLSNTYETGMDKLEAQGRLGSTEYYTAMNDAEKKNLATLNNELSSLTQSFSDAMASGEIEEYSEAWYAMQQSINDTKEAIDESTLSILENEKAMRELEWSYFDYIQDRISQITQESNFLIDLISNSKLYEDNGQFNDNGMATLGLRAQNYNVYMAQADQYANEILKLDEEIAKDPYNTDLIERREELLGLQQDSILAAEDEKQAIVDLVREGIEIELDALQSLIDKYTDTIDTAKDLYDYQKGIEEQSKEIATIQKQIAAYSGDNSEETKTTIQKLQVDLSDALDELEETQYERYISEQKQMLDNLYLDYETILNARLDNVDALMSEMIDTVNANSTVISDTLISTSDKVGYTISEAMSSIWSNEGSASAIVAKYGDSFTGQLTTVNQVLSSISTNVAKMVAESDQEAQETVKPTTPTTTPSAPSTPSTPPSPSTPSKPTPTTPTTNTKFNEDVKRGVAAAIWIYGGSKSGWGNNPDRKKRLTAKFGASNAEAVQSYINAHGSNGDLYEYWAKNKKNNLSKYYYSAFKTGGLADYTGFAWMDGTPNKPELVLNAEDTENLIGLRDVLRNMSQNTLSLDNPNYSGFDFSKLSGLTDISGILARISVRNGNAGGSIGEINITIPIDHVENYDDFVNQLRKDKKFEQLIQSMTVDRLTGGSSLAKNKYKW